MTAKPNAPACERNKRPILEVIRIEFRDCRNVLEIGSGTGQHAVYFANAMPWLNWQTSDLAGNHKGIAAWIADARLPNVRDPLLLDVQRSGGFSGEYDGVFSANTAHIMSMPGVHCMFSVAGRLLPHAGRFCLYGPFNRDGRPTSETNRLFDQSLRSQDSSMGIRDLEVLAESAARSAMRLERLYAMPANNALAVWRKRESAEVR
ncbi:MAG: DUF938 domain-containing protein [Woeseia sp.]